MLTRIMQVHLKPPMSQSFDIADIAVVIPVLNQLSFTINCVDSLIQAGLKDAQIIIINNGSTDGTREFLASRPGLHAIHNEINRGCGQAWTQGAKASTARWTVIVNNDVLVPPGCLEGLCQSAETSRLNVVSPAMAEGVCDYDWRTYAVEFMQKMQSARRTPSAHGVCFLVPRRIFETVGYFSDDYEDDEFFRRVSRAGFGLVTTGSAFLHHFGSMTQKSLKPKDSAAKLQRRAEYRKQTGQTWINRKFVRLRNGLRDHWWRTTEKLRYGRTIVQRREAGRWSYR